MVARPPLAGPAGRLAVAPASSVRPWSCWLASEGGIESLEALNHPHAAAAAGSKDLVDACAKRAVAELTRD
jgi:hypothetical protein